MLSDIIQWPRPSLAVCNLEIEGSLSECSPFKSVSKLSNESLPILKCLQKKASGKLRWYMWISNQDSTGQGNVQYGWKPRRRRRLLSSWVRVSINCKSRILPNKTRSNCWLATVRFCMASKEKRRAIKTFRGSILIRDQSLTGNDIKRNTLSRNLGIYFHWLTFVVTQTNFSSANAITKTKNLWLQNFQFFC